MKNMKRFFFLALVFALIASLTVGAGAPLAPDGPRIHLERFSFDPLAGEPDFSNMGPLAGPDDAIPGENISLLQFDGPVQPEWKEGAEAAGIELLAYVPDFAFVVRLKGISAEEASALPHVRWIGPYRIAYKMASSLGPLVAGESHEMITLFVSLFPGAETAPFLDAVRALGGAIEDQASGDLSGEGFRVSLPAHGVLDLARLPGVEWVEPYLPMELFNDEARDIMRVDQAQATLAGMGTNLYGAGQIVAVADTGLDSGNASTLSLDFRGRLVRAYALGRSGNWSDGAWYEGYPQGGHGTHVAGSVLGNGQLSGSNPASHNYANSFAGVAPEAQLVFQSVMDSSGNLSGIPSDLKQLFTPAYNDGARIHTNSWGHPTGGSYPNYTYGAYDSSARYVDEFMWLNPSSLVLFAAGNEGVDADANGIIDLDKIASPGTAKNVLTVGATENNRPPFSGWGGYANYVWGTGSWEPDYPVNPIHDDYISNNVNGLAAFSSRGPTDDGRVKPEVVAPGTNIISNRSQASGGYENTGWGAYNSNYVYNGGTSMATPLTAGAAALVRQYYAQVLSYSTPSAALIKATLINGAQNIAPGQYGTGAAQEIPNNAPNNVIGFGRVNVMDALGLNPNEHTAYWDNKSGLGTGGMQTHMVSITQTVTSDALFVVTLCWTDYPGTVGAGKALVNDLDLEVIAPNGTSNKGNGGANWDRLNNSERVVIKNPQAGTYQIIVRGYNVPNGPQPYAVVARSRFLSTSIATPTATTPPRTPTPTATRGTPVGGRRTWLPLLVKSHPRPTPTPTSRPTATPTATPQLTTRTFTSAADTCVLEGYPTQNFGNTADMLAGYDDYLDPDGKIARSLVKFNIAGIPAGTTVERATLRVFLFGSYDFEGWIDTITAYRAAGNWAEMSVNWNNRPTVGESYSSVTVPTYSDPGGWYELDVTALVQGWVNGAIANQGIYIRGEEASGALSSWRSFSTREGPYPPQLVVRYWGSGVEAPMEPAPAVGAPVPSILEELGQTIAPLNDGRELLLWK